MNRLFALLGCVPFIVWLWRLDAKNRPQLSGSFWIPVLWVLILGSRPISWWLGVGGGGSDGEGNWFDRSLYLILTFVAIVILAKRRISWQAVASHNKALLFLYLFLLLTVIWSPFPFVAFKRWYKEVGAIFIVLLILTEKQPLEAFKALCARCAYVWFPLSLIFTKFFGEIGRAYSRGGFVMYTGVSGHKNGLGVITLLAGLGLLSELLTRPAQASEAKWHYRRLFFILALGIWLIFISNSKTSQICLVIGGIVVCSHKIPIFRRNPSAVVAGLLVVTFTYVIAESLFGVSDQILRMLGRDPTLTERTEIWEAIRKNPVDPLVGGGYMMYWSMHRGIGSDDSFWSIKSAHNGYLETYLDGGAIAVLLLSLVLLVVGLRVVREFMTGSEYGRLALAIYLATLLYNIAESAYTRRSPIWFAFLVFAINWRVLADARGAGGEPVGRMPEIREAPI